MGRVREREEERRSEKKKSQKKEDAGARKGRKVATHWKNAVNRDFSIFRAPASSFFLLFLFLVFFSSSLLFPESSHLCFSSVHVVGSLTSKLPPINMVLCDGIDKEVYSSRFNHAHIDMWPAVSCVAWQSLRSNVRGMSSACRWRPM